MKIWLVLGPSGTQQLWLEMKHLLMGVVQF